MSGRAYARNPSGALGGATDINSIVPHRFCIDAPRPASAAKQLAIRRAIQRRCKEKNWKKLLRMRHARLVPPAEALLAAENGAVENAAQPPQSTATTAENGAAAENGATRGAMEQPAANGVQENGGDVTMEEPAVSEAKEEEKTAAVEETAPVATEQQQQQEALDTAKQQLQEMEEKLAALSADKHAKFQLLKDLLIAEARAKVTGPPPMPKKRRVDSLGSAVGMSPHLSGGSAGGFEGAGLSLLGAPSPSLLRAQSFSTSHDIDGDDASFGLINNSMKRHGGEAEIDAAVVATVDGGSKGDVDGVRDVEMAGSAVKLALKSDREDVGVVDATGSAGFHRSLGTRNTSKSHKPKPFLRDESFKRITRSPVPFGSLSEAFAFTVFLLLFIFATSVVDQDEQGFYFSNRVRVALTDRDFEIAIQHGASSVQKRFVGIHDHADVWAFLQGPFLDAVYGTSLLSETDQDTQAKAGTMMLSYNRVLGGVRFRSLRVKPDSCPPLARIPEYSSLVPYCYGRFSRSVEQKEGYGPILNSADITAAMCFKFAHTFFADKQSSKVYADLLTCNSDCERSCGDHYGVERYRYTKECSSACGVHCKCIYEQPVGFTNLCPDPNPNGANAGLPTAIYAYNWSDATWTGASKVTAYTNAYPASGYVVDLPLNATLATQLVARMKQDRFLDLATRALVIDFTVFNAYLQLFNIVQLIIEFPASGGVFVSFSDVVIDVFQYSTPYDAARIVLELLLVAFIAWGWKGLLQNWYHMGLRTYFAYDTLWHTIEFLHLTMFLVVIAFRLYVIDLSYGTLSGSVTKTLSSSTPAQIPTFQSLARVREIDAILSSVNAAFVWMQFLKYTQMSKRMGLLLRTLRRASADLFWFLVYFITCICAFAQIGFLLFGLQLARFRSLGVSIVTLLQAVAGDLEYATLVDAHRALGPIYYVAFYLLLLLILLNVFLAIVNDAYVQTLSEQEEEDEAEEVALLRSEHTGDSASADANADIESHLKRIERRELEQLRKYPFSKGISPAVHLLLADLKRTLYELRTGKRIFKVDPMVTGMLGVMGGGGGGTGELNAISPGQRTSGVASRKLTIQVKRQLEKQMQIQELARDAKRAQEDKVQREAVETQQKELAMRLTTLVESNRDKARRMDDMENVLGSIEKLCQQLVAAAMEDVPATPKRPTTTAQGAAAARPLTGTTALSMALQRQKTTGKGIGATKNVEGEIEEITL